MNMHYENQKNKTKWTQIKTKKNTPMCCKDKTLKANILESNQGYKFNDGV